MRKGTAGSVADPNVLFGSAASLRARRAMTSSHAKSRASFFRRAFMALLLNSPAGRWENEIRRSFFRVVWYAYDCSHEIP